MMEKLKVNRAGFITNYLISGPREEDYVNHETDDNQLRYEQHLRTLVADRREEAPEGEVRLGEDSGLGIDVYKRQGSNRIRGGSGHRL